MKRMRLSFGFKNKFNHKHQQAPLLSRVSANVGTFVPPTSIPSSSTKLISSIPSSSTKLLSSTSVSIFSNSFYYIIIASVLAISAVTIGVLYSYGILFKTTTISSSLLSSSTSIGQSFSVFSFSSFFE